MANINLKQMFAAAPMPTAAPDMYAVAEQQKALAEELRKRSMQGGRIQGMSTTGQSLGIGLAQLGEALLARHAGKNAQATQASADAKMRDATSHGIEKLAGAYEIGDVAGEGTTPLLGGSLPGSKIQTALAGQDPRAANQVIAQALFEKAMPAPQPSDTFVSGGDGMIFGNRSGRVVREPNAKPDEWSNPVAGTVSGKPAFARTRKDKLGYYDDKGTLIDGFQPKESGPQVVVNTGDKADLEFLKALAKADADKVVKYRETADASNNLLSGLDRMRKLNDSAMDGGTADARLAVSNWIEGLTGVKIAADKVKDSQQFNSAANEAVLGTLGGKLGGQVSNTDLSFVQRIVPQLSMNRQARQELIDFLSTRAKRRMEISQQAEDYARQNNGFKGWREPSLDPESGGPSTGKTEEWVRNSDGKLVRK